MCVHHNINVGRHMLIFYFWGCASCCHSLKSPVSEYHDVMYSDIVDGGVVFGKTNKEKEEDYLTQLTWP